MNRILITGANGMVGSHLLKIVMNSNEVSEVISLVRKPSTITHSKLREVKIKDFKTYESSQEYFKEIDAAYFCIGVYTGQVPDRLFKEITIDYAVQFARLLQAQSPNARLCLLSGAGADRTEKSNASFAKYKGVAENKISALGLEFYAFRPGYIYPVTPRKEPNIMYKILRFLYPFMSSISPNTSIKSTDLAQTLYHVGLNGAQYEILENKDILKYT